MIFRSAFAVMKAPRLFAALGLLLAATIPALAQCPLSFAPAVNYAAGSNPQSVAVVPKSAAKAPQSFN